MNTTELIADIKIEGSVPENDQFNDPALLALADTCIEQNILPRIIEQKAEYFVFSNSLPVTKSKRKYRINWRAYGGILRDVLLQSGNRLSSITQMNSEDVESLSEGNPCRFYLESNSVCLYPIPGSTDGSQLVQKFLMTPGKLISTGSCGQVVAFDAALKQVTLSQVPASFVPGKKIDAIKGTPGHEIIQIDATIQSVVGSVVTLDALSDELEDLDWFAPCGYSPFPNIPLPLHSVLSLFTAAKVFQSLGLSDQEKNLLAKAENSLNVFLGVASPRVIGEPEQASCVLF